MLKRFHVAFSQVRKINPNLIAITLCLGFILVCLNYSSKINVWGDEAFSLQLAEKSWHQIYTTYDVHLPTYYFLLKIVTFFFGSAKEIGLRLLHALLFSIGLFIGYRLILFVSGSQKKALLALLAGVVSPTLIFYATNLRMYSLLFLLAMFYLLRLAIILFKKDDATAKEWLYYLAASVGLVLIDYPGLIVFLFGTVLVGAKLFKIRKLNYLFLALSPLASLLIYYFQILPSLQNILTSKTGLATEIMGKGDLFGWVKLGFSVFRPVFDNFSISQKNALLAFVVPIVFAASLFLTLGFFLGKQLKRPNFKVLLTALFAFYWLVLAFSGQSLSRVFLPSLFFMPAFLLLSMPWLPNWLAKLNIIVFALLLGTNFLQILNPTLNLYSVIPYQAIAFDSAQLAKKDKINYVFLSANSLNSVSIERYLEKDDVHLHLALISTNFKEQSLPKKETFLLVSHLGENDNFFDYHQLGQGYQVTNVNNYVKLADLPYNYFWKKQITDRAFQDYAVSVYEVKSLK